MEIILNNLINETRDTNSKLKNIHDLIKQPVEFKPDPKIEETKTLLNTANNNQEEAIRANENDKKRFKLMQRYKTALIGISNLLEMMPANLDDLSLEELDKNLLELNDSRKKNYDIMKFDHYQNLFSETTNELLQIEADFQTGKITSKQAAQRVGEVENKLETTQIPKSLESTKDEVQYLIKMYKEEFGSLADSKIQNLTDLSPEITKNYNIKEKFKTLNQKTNDLSDNIANLHTKISNFEPTVNLDSLYLILQITDEEVAKDDWNYDAVSSKVLDLENETKALQSAQGVKNLEHEKLAEEVKEVTKESVDVKTECTNDIVITMHKNANIRSQNSIEVISTVKDETMLASTFLNVAQQYANVVTEQAETDNKVCIKVTSETTGSEYDVELNQEALNNTDELKAQIELQQQNMLLVKPDSDSEDENPPVT